MKLKYYILDPTGNITILAEGDVPAAGRAATAAKLMELEPTAEQVGFVCYGRTSAEKNCDTDHDISLTMAGGEFCGNATMSAAVLRVARENGGFAGETSGTRRKYGIYEVDVLASGAEGIRRVHVEEKEDGSYFGSVDMPKPLSVKKETLSFEGKEYELPVVDFGGITHVIIDIGECGLTLFTGSSEKRDFCPDPELRQNAEKAVKEWCDALRAECLGLMMFDSTENRLDPLVYVPEAGTLVWESSCASGTTAVGVYLAQKEDAPIRRDINEPGGSLSIEVTPGSKSDRSAGAGKRLLSGTVKIIRAGEADI